MQRLKLFPMALPPVAEQKRIVDRVDELMALCDKLEAAQAKREKRRDRLVAATLHGLNNGDASPAPGTHPAFKDSARFYLNHLPRLTTRPQHIHQLRQTILNLAVRGKLVPQDPNDEPAEELLARIAATKLRLQAQGRIGREKLVDPVETDNLLFEIPKSWRWAKLAELTELITKGSSPKWQGIGYTSESDGVLFITSENVGNYRLRKLDDLKYVEKRFNEIEPRSILKRGDILRDVFM
jgi:type I restriction enzyme S subunit